MNNINLQEVKLCQETDIKPFKCVNADLYGSFFLI
jgi:hypothetical protein